MNPLKLIPETKLATFYLRYFGFLKIPLIYFVRPTVIELTNKKVTIKIPFRRRTKNHLKSMYFGVLAVGADVAGGLIAWNLIRESSERIALIFKSFKAEFLKRAEGDVYFTCEQGNDIQNLVKAAIASNERVEKPITVIATVPGLLGDEPIANFTLVLSLKKK